MSDEIENERARVAERLRRVREDVRQRALAEDAPTALPEARPVRAPEPVPGEEPASAEPPPSPPDGSGVNALWRAEPEGPAPGRLSRWLRRLLAPYRDAQVAFNSRQVQLDNELLEYIDGRFETTHRHYDEVLGRYGRHIGEIDERHMIVQEELVAHVHDLVRRIDLVLGHADRGRLDLEHALQELRERLVRLEARLGGE